MHFAHLSQAATVLRSSSRHPAEKLADLDYADDIALLEDCIEAAQDLLKRVEKACQEVGLHLNAPKTQRFVGRMAFPGDVVGVSQHSCVCGIETFLTFHI